MESPIDPKRRRRPAGSVSPVTGKVLLRQPGAPPTKPKAQAEASARARHAAIMAALPIRPADPAPGREPDKAPTSKRSKGE